GLRAFQQLRLRRHQCHPRLPPHLSPLPPRMPERVTRVPATKLVPQAPATRPSEMDRHNRWEPVNFTPQFGYAETQRFAGPVQIFGLQTCEYSGNARRAVEMAANATSLGDLLVTAIHSLRVLAALLFS